MGLSFTDEIKEAATLSDYVWQRYPGPAELVTEEEYQKAIRLAQSVLVWAENLIE